MGNPGSITSPADQHVPLEVVAKLEKLSNSGILHHYRDSR